MGTKSKSGSPSWLPSYEGKSFSIQLQNEEETVLNIKYTPEPVIKELSKLFSYLYLLGNGIKIPKSLLVRSDSPLFGVLTASYAMGEHFVKTGTGKRRRVATEEAIIKGMNAIENNTTGDKDPTAETILENLPKINKSDMAYVVGSRTAPASDYIAEHLSEKIQSALCELIIEAEIYVWRTIAEQQGIKPKDIKREQVLINEIKKSIERGIKRRLGTRRAGGKNRALTLKDRFSSEEFRAIVDERLPLVKEMISIRKQYGKDQWREKLAESKLFYELSATIDAFALTQLQDLLEERLHPKTKDRNLKTEKAFACALVAYEYNVQSDNGEYYSTRTLLDYYDDETEKPD